MTRPTNLIAGMLLLLGMPLPAAGEAGLSTAPGPAAPASIASAQALYETAQYRQAALMLKQLRQHRPDSSAIHHLLGKCYGRLAEEAGPFQAMTLARKTLRSFEQAVALDGRNTAALTDLIAYYKKAPRFLGGSRQKAARWQRTLKRLQGDKTTGSTKQPDPTKPPARINTITEPGGR